MTQSIHQLLDVLRVRGADAPPEPTVLIEAPHGATLRSHYDAWAARLTTQLPENLDRFFSMNTDVGSWAMADALADAWVKADPTAHVLAIRCRIPRTFVDVNRDLGGTQLGNLTAGLPAYIDAADHPLLTQAHRTYTAAVEQAYADILGRGGKAVILHTYGPHTLPIQRVDADIVHQLEAAYAALPDDAPKRAEVDLITQTPDGVNLAHTPWVTRATEALQRAGFDVRENHTYTLHPASMAHVWAARWPSQTVAIEVRRDLLVPEWIWHSEMRPAPEKVAKVVDALCEAWA